MGRFHRHDGEHGHQHTHGEDHEHTHGDDHKHPHDHDRPSPVEKTAHDLGDHSGYDTGSDRIDVLERIFDENDRTAAANRADIERAGAFALNVMSSPGAGKTSLLRETLTRLGTELRIGVVEGDIETSIDADRLAGLGAVIELVNTGNGFGGECHLDAPMVRSALKRLPLDTLEVVIVENVGNLVCPAEFDVGEHTRVMVFSVTEGEDKPLKYPVMFRSADLVLINKVDLLPHLDFDMDLFERNLNAVNPTARRIRMSVRTGEGVNEWCNWLTSAARERSGSTRDVVSRG